MQVTGWLTVLSMAATNGTPTSFGQALDRALNGRQRAWLGAEVARLCGKETPITASAVAQWINGDTEPARQYVFAAEEVLSLKPGTLSRILGYLPVAAKPAVSVLDAIDADPSLSEKMRDVLRAAYRSAIG